MNIVIFGPPGSGKGTQSKFLQEKFGFVQLSSGDLVRAEIAAGTETGKKIKDAVDRGAYASDDLIIGLFKKAYDPSQTGYIFDGFPRTVNQATVLDSMLADINQKIDCVFNIVISDESLKQRIVGRYSCATCGAIYNRYFNNPKTEGVCDVCQGTNFTTRSDDVEATLLNRLKTHHDVTTPVLTYYKARTDLIEIDGEQDVEAVKKQIESNVTKVLSKKQTVKCAHS
jgi:adenylate kinase